MNLSFFFNNTSSTEIYTLSLHDALPISFHGRGPGPRAAAHLHAACIHDSPARVEIHDPGRRHQRSEEHTSELQSRGHLVCRLLLEKKKKNKPSDSTASSQYCATPARRSS